jgi:hypothetical protein
MCVVNERWGVDCTSKLPNIDLWMLNSPWPSKQSSISRQQPQLSIHTVIDNAYFSRNLSRLFTDQCEGLFTLVTKGRDK